MSEKNKENMSEKDVELDPYGKLLEKHGLLKERILLGEVSQRYIKFIDDFLVIPENIKKLRGYLPEKGVDIDLDTVKVWLLLMRRGNSEDISRLLSILEPTEYGWRKNKYIHHNPCIRGGLRCRPRRFMHDIKEVKASFAAVKEIFFDEEYGGITLLIFSYCLAALFSSQLNRANLPRYIQIACAKNTTLYNLIREIVAICDVNMGILEKCTSHHPWSCGYEQKIIFPLQDIDRSISLLSSVRDIPVIVDGHENIRGYRALLREIANKPNKEKLTGNRDNLLPIFICPSISSDFDNVFSMDLTGETVSEDYLDLVKRNKAMLSSLVNGMVMEPIECLFPEDGTEDDRNAKYIDGEYPFSSEIAKSVNTVRGMYKSSHQTAKNVGVLCFVFLGIMRSLQRAISTKEIPNDKEFAYSGELSMQNTIHHLNALSKQAVKSLVEIHSRYSPVPIDLIVVDVQEVEPGGAKTAEKKARKCAADIVRCYKSFGTSISITSIKIKGERFIFDVELLDGTRRHQVFKDAENVKVALKMKPEYFRPSVTGSSLVIVMSEKLLREDSLIRIMDSPLFRESKLKIPFAMGYDIVGDMVVEDLAKFTHTLIGGSTGSGKSTALHTLVLSIVCKQSADDVKLLIFDYGTTFLAQFRKVPHLAHPIVDDMATGHLVIDELYAEMERRRKIYSSNPDDRSEFHKLPYIFCIIDEFPKFIEYGDDRKKQKELQLLIRGLLEQARGLKIFMVLAAQDPTEENMKCGTTNLDTVLAFKCGGKHNSRVMRVPGAEELLGDGDMLFKSKGIKSIQGAYIDEKNIAEYLEKHMCTSGDSKQIITILELGSGNSVVAVLTAEDVFDKNVAEIIMLLLSQKQISNDAIQKHLEVGYHQANKYMDKLVKYRLLPPLNGKRKPRKLIPAHLDDMPSKALEHLERHGYTTADIASAFAAFA